MSFFELNLSHPLGEYCSTDAIFLTHLPTWLYVQVPDAILVHWAHSRYAKRRKTCCAMWRKQAKCSAVTPASYTVVCLTQYCLAELEEAGASLDSHLDTVDELLTLALQPKKEGLGGVDQYLIHKLAQSQPSDIKSAMARLCRGMQNSIKVQI